MADATRTVTQSAANAEEGSLVDELAGAANKVERLTTELRTYLLNHPLGNPGFAINSNFDIANANAIDYVAGGLLKTLSATTNFDTGTSKTIATDQWAAAILSVDADGTTHVDWGADAADESSALAALSDVTVSGDVVLGSVAVQTASGQDWVAGTDALQGGTGGNPAQTTNYYDDVNPDDTVIGAEADDISYHGGTSPA